MTVLLRWYNQQVLCQLVYRRWGIWRTRKSFTKPKYSNCYKVAVITEIGLILLIDAVGIPKLLWYGSEGDYNILAMDLLGANLETLKKEMGGKFSLQTTLLLAEQMVSFITLSEF